MLNPTPKQLDLFQENLAGLKKWAGFFPKFKEEDKRDAIKSLRETLAAMPAELRKEALLELRKLEREEKL